MSYRIKGFVTIEELAANADGVIADIGELSTYARTYSKDITSYGSDDNPTYQLSAFVSALDNGTKLAVPVAFRDLIFEFTKWAYDKQSISTRATSRDDFLADLVDAFDADATSINCGELIQATSELLYPEYMSFRKTGIAGGDPMNDNTVVIWYSNESFTNQYDEFVLEIAPPIADIDDFFAGKTAVLASLGAVTFADYLAALEEAKDKKPETIFSAEVFDYVDPIDDSHTATNWSVVIYGQAGNDLDLIRERIREYIGANSSHTEAEWRVIFPDIFKSSEFVVFPRYSNMAIPDRELQVGTYSPLIRMNKEVNYMKLRLADWGATYVATHAMTMPCNYRSLALLICGSPDNRSGQHDIDNIYPDILNLPTSDTMFRTMEPNTRAFLLRLQEMIVAAEAALIYSVLPAGMRKSTRAGVTFVVAKIQSMNYLVATKFTTPDYV